MNELKIFENEEFGQVRTVMIDGEPWFVGKDVAEALGYKEPTKAARERVDDEDKGVTEMMTPGGKQNLIIINESGLYALIFGSKLESAKRFKRWVTSEVLPALRKTGTYSIPPHGQTEDTVQAKQRGLTKDDYIRAASIIAGCRNERLPYVMAYLEQAGFDALEQVHQKTKPENEGQAEGETFEEYVEELMVAAWERRGRTMMTCRQFNDFCASHKISARKFRRWLYKNGYIMAHTNGKKTDYSITIWSSEANGTQRCIVFNGA